MIANSVDGPSRVSDPSVYAISASPVASVLSVSPWRSTWPSLRRREAAAPFFLISTFGGLDLERGERLASRGRLAAAPASAGHRRTAPVAATSSATRPRPRGRRGRRRSSRAITPWRAPGTPPASAWASFRPVDRRFAASVDPDHPGRRELRPATPEIVHCTRLRHDTRQRRELSAHALELDRADRLDRRRGRHPVEHLVGQDDLAPPGGRAQPRARR